MARKQAPPKLRYNPLDQLVSGDEAPTVTELDPAEIEANPYQPRRSVDHDAQRELVASILEGGIHEPLIVRELEGNGFQLVAGSRRLAAAMELGLERVPVVVRSYSDVEAEQVALIENLQRSNLRFDDEAEALNKLKSRFTLTNEQIARAIGKSTDYVELRIAAAAHPQVLAMYLAGDINMAEIMPTIRNFRMASSTPQPVHPKLSDDENDTQPTTRQPRRPHSAFRPLTAALTTLSKLDAAPLDESEAEQLIEYALKLREIADRIIEKRRAVNEEPVTLASFLVDERKD